MTQLMALCMPSFWNQYTANNDMMNQLKLARDRKLKSNFYSNEKLKNKLTKISNILKTLK